MSAVPFTPDLPAHDGPDVAPLPRTVGASAVARSTAPAAQRHSGAVTQLRQWLVACRNAGATPAEIASELVDAGWDADAAERAALESLRTSDRRSGLFAATAVFSGVAALSVGSAAHLLLDGNVDPVATTSALTAAVVTVPVAVVCAVLADRATLESKFVVWSPERRFWFGALASCTAVVGLFRAFVYVYGFLAGMTGAAEAPSMSAFGQVLVSLSISVPLFVWSAAQWRRSNVARSGLVAAPDRD